MSVKSCIQVGLGVVCLSLPMAPLADTVQPDLSGGYTAHPPVPAEDASIDQLHEWKETYIFQAGWSLGSVDEKRIIFFDVDSLERLPDNHVTAWTRAELYRPTYREGQGIRSVLKKLEIDCGDLRMRELQYIGFSSSNLQDVIRPGQSWNPQWTEPTEEGTGPGIAVRATCNAAGVKN